jgi:hypothetical protein
LTTVVKICIITSKISEKYAVVTSTEKWKNGKKERTLEYIKKLELTMNYENFAL